MLKNIKPKLGNRRKFFVEILLQTVSPYGILLLSLIMTSFAWHYTAKAIERDSQNNFKLQVNEAKNSLDFRLKTYINILQASQGLFAASQSVERNEWKAFVQSLNLQTLYPGIKGMGFIRYVPNSRKADYERQVRLDTSIEPNGYPDFAIKPAGERPTYFVIEYMEPLPANRPAFGLDINSEAVRRAAAQRARDTGQAAATGRIILVQDPTKQPGLLILLPVYRHRMPHSTVEEKRRALLGFIYAPLRVTDLIAEALPKVSEHGLDLEVYNGKDLIYDSDRVQQVKKPNLQPLHQETTLDVAGETWQLYFTSHRASQALWMPTPILVLSSGTLISLLLFGIMRSLTYSRQRAFQLATRMTAELSLSNAELQTEIKQRQQVEEELKATTRLQNAILDSANYTIISTTVDGTILTFNTAAERWLGYTAAEVVGKTTPAIIHDFDEIVRQAQELSVELGVHIEPGFEVFVAKARLGKFYEREWTYIRKDGTRFPILLSVTALYDTQKHLTGFLGIGSDITERKQMEVKINESEQRFRVAFNDAAIGMALVAPQGRFLQVNRSLCEIVGYSEAQLKAIDFQSITHPDDLDADLNYIRQMLNDEIRTYQMEKRYIHKSGQIVWILLSVSLVRDKLNQPLYFIAQLENISERKQTTERIAASLTEKEILLKEVHHRVKNNLQVIDSLFRHQCRQIKEPKITQIIKECQNRVSSMAILHEKLYQSKNLAHIDVSEYLQSLVANLYDSYKINGTLPTLQINVETIFIKLEIALSCGLILNELVSNCLKYAFPKGTNGYLTIQFLSNNKDNYTLIVKDNGIGLPKDFDLEKTNSLGLKLVKSFVRQLQGKIEVNTDNGTEFTILFKG